MSTFAAPVVQFTLTKMPNADSLSLATVKGWQCVVRTSEFFNESLGVYIPLDAVAAKDHPLLSFMEGKKVKTIRLRQTISQGILLPLNKVIETYPLAFKKLPEVGEDLASILDIKKWEPPVEKANKVSVPDFMALELPSFMQKYTDIENIKNFPNILQIDEEVMITCKLHGTSSRFGFSNGNLYIGSRNRGLRTENFITQAGELKEIKKTVWHDVVNTDNILDKLVQLSNIFGGKRDIILYGEIVGKGIQSLDYGHDIPTFYAYDISIDDEFGQRYVDPVHFRSLCEKVGLRMVPLLKMGKYSLEDINLKNGQSTIANHIREGIVIEPLVPRFDPELGRVKIKAINEEYLLSKGMTDY